MQDLIRHLPAAIFEYAVFSGGTERFTYVSEKCQDVLGLNAAALEASPAALYDIVHREDLNFLKITFSNASIVKGP